MKKHFDAGMLIQTVQSDYQLIQVAQHPTHGKVLLLDRNVQLTEKDEHLYHDQIMNLIPHPSRGPSKFALVIGGGDGYITKRLIPSFLVDVVEIDPAVVEVSRKHFAGDVFDDDGVTLEIADAEDYVTWAYENNFLYDVIILDITDPSEGGIESGLLTVDFLSYCHDLLKQDGVVIVQSGCPVNNKQHYCNIDRMMNDLFVDVRSSSQYVESYGEQQSFIAGYVK